MNVLMDAPPVVQGVPVVPPLEDRRKLARRSLEVVHPTVEERREARVSPVTGDPAAVQDWEPFIERRLPVPLQNAAGHTWASRIKRHRRKIVYAMAAGTLVLASATLHQRHRAVVVTELMLASAQEVFPLYRWEGYHRVTP